MSNFLTTQSVFSKLGTKHARISLVCEMEHHVFAECSIKHLVDYLLGIHPLVIILMAHQSIPYNNSLLRAMDTFFIESKLAELLSDHLMCNKGTEGVITLN